MWMTHNIEMAFSGRRYIVSNSGTPLAMWKDSTCPKAACASFSDGDTSSLGLEGCRVSWTGWESVDGGGRLREHSVRKSICHLRTMQDDMVESTTKLNDESKSILVPILFGNTI
jgi:hypothetical protein